MRQICNDPNIFFKASYVERPSWSWAPFGLDGKPNIAVRQFTDVLDDEYVLMPDLFAQKTKINLNENLVGALTVAWPSEFNGWTVQGPCNIFPWGHPPNYSAGRAPGSAGEAATV